MSKKNSRRLELEKLANRLRDTTQNVYRLHESLVGRKCGEEVFKELEEKCGLFKCEQCDTWQGVEERDMQYGDDEDAARMCYNCSLGERE